MTILPWKSLDTGRNCSGLTFYNAKIKQAKKPWWYFCPLNNIKFQTRNNGVFNFSYFFTAATGKKKTLPSRFLSYLKLLFCFFAFWLRKESHWGFHRWLFVVHARFYSRVREKTKAFLTSLTSFQQLHLRWVWVLHFFLSRLTPGIIILSFLRWPVR